MYAKGNRVCASDYRKVPALEKFDRDTSKKKVGVITLPGDFNYGGKLQLYAVMHLYRELDFEPEFLVLERQFRLIAHPKEMVRRMLRKPSSQSIGLEKLQPPARRAAFLRFSTSMRPRVYKSPDDVSTNEFAFFSVGSDQVWNPNYIFTESEDNGVLKRLYHCMTDPRELLDERDWYFLRFSRRGQRIALAPSFGVNDLGPSQAKLEASGLREFDRLSVRERAGADLIMRLTGQHAEVLCDPTLVLDKTSWRLASDDRVTPEGPYVLAYVLGEETSEVRTAIGLASQNGELPVVRLSDQARLDEPDAGPAEFLSLVEHATSVVSDSFHASVFASIFERPLVIVHRQGTKQGGMFSRLESLSKILGIEDKIFDGAYDASAHADYEGVADAIASERDRFVEYLESALSQG
jgi:hypothetical protein